MTKCLLVVGESSMTSKIASSSILFSASISIHLREGVNCSMFSTILFIINFPTFESGSSKFKYSKVLLFYPLAPGAEVSEEDVERLFYETNVDQPLDIHNKRLTIVQNNERKFYQRLLYEI